MADMASSKKPTRAPTILADSLFGNGRRESSVMNVPAARAPSGTGWRRFLMIPARLLLWFGIVRSRFIRRFAP
ncbi:hypothetical protein LP420_12900 [Massilia sp. B-10]|nr:hypothetical protein LP420_12900 [Massilia sp. B-10]